MADSNISIFQSDGSTTKIDTRTETTNTENRQVVVLGDPSINANVVSAVTADPGGSSTTPGIVVRMAGSMVLAPGSSTIGTVTANAGTGTFNIFIPDTGHELGSIRGNTNTLTVFLPDTGHELGSIRGNTNTLTVFLPDTGHELGTIRGNTNTLTVFIPDTGHEIGAIRGNTNTLTVFIPDTGHTLGKVDAGAGTFSVAFSPSGPLVLANTSATTVVSSAGSSVGGSTAAVSTSGATIVSPEAGRNIKVYAFSLTTTGIVPMTLKFTQGSGASPTTLWQVGLQAAANTNTGANLAVTPPAYLFATGTGNTLSLVNDTASLIHYSVAYFKESA